MLDRGKLVPDGFDQEEEILVDEKDLVLGVVYYMDQVFLGQADVHGVEHGAVTGNAEIKLEVAMIIESETGYTVPAFDAQRLEGMGQLAGALVVVGITITKYLVGIYRNDLFFRVEPGRPQEKISK